ncbi:MAG: hypothetical protein LBL61_02605 [Elusimicrobiota bacterium]|jgi:hypothetical protein|nr:hypothetical protein [Elusimicrobiota bacterium]
MKYWVFMNDEVIATPYEAAELRALPGFNGQTLIMPCDAPEGTQWLAAQNFGDVITAPEPEVYQENTDPNTIPASYAREAAVQPEARQEPAAAVSDLEKTLFDKMDSLLNEIRSLKQELNTFKSARADAPEPAKAAPQQEEPEQEESRPVPGVIYGSSTRSASEPVLVLPGQNFNTEEIGDLASPDAAAANDNFLQNAVQADISRREQLASTAAATEECPKQEADLLNLATLRCKKQEPASEPAPQAVQPEPAQKVEEVREIEEEKVEEIKEEALPAIEELQAEELQAEPYAGETPRIDEQPAQEEEYKPEPLPADSDAHEPDSSSPAEPEPVEQPAEEAPQIAPDVPIREELEPLGPTPAQQADISDEITALTARIADTSNEQEESVLKEFAQDKNMAADAQNYDKNFQILEPEQEEKPAESLEELTSRSAAVGEEAAQNAPVQNVQAVEDDKFLKTFTTGIEEVFMDQPTSIISDYVPPAIADTSPLAVGANQAAQEPLIQKAVGDLDEEQFSPLEDLTDKSMQEASSAQPTVQSVRRIKPAAIKTVPMVSSDGRDIKNLDYGEPQVEEIIVDAEPSSVLKFVKMFSALVVLFVMMLMIVALLGWMKIIPQEWSPLHSILDKFAKPAAAEQAAAPEAQVPAAATQSPDALGGDAAYSYAQEQDAALSQVIASARNYLLLDGMTLGEKIESLYPSSAGGILWSANPAIDPGDYSVVITLPPNNEGYSMSYRFNYNLNTRLLTPTTSEANNLMNQKVNPPER